MTGPSPSRSARRTLHPFRPILAVAALRTCDSLYESSFDPRPAARRGIRCERPVTPPLRLDSCIRFSCIRLDRVCLSPIPRPLFSVSHSRSHVSQLQKLKTSLLKGAPIAGQPRKSYVNRTNIALTDEERTAFQKLKDLICAPDAVVHPEPSRTLLIDLDWTYARLDSV